MKQAYQYLFNLINEKEIVVVGCSGGPDSMALLYMLNKIRSVKNIYLVCAHVNHNIRTVSKEEQLFVEKWCLDHDIVFETMTIQKYGDDNFENEARTIRYKFFNDIVRKYNANYLMTAHHGDDLMETILMRIVRGSTLNGYAGFHKLVDNGNYKIVRPLIFTTKSEIMEYDKKYNIPYVIDKTNFDDIHTRNRYRKVVLPFLKKENPNVHEKFIKFSNTLEKYNDYINKQASRYFYSVYHDNVLDIPKYLELDEVIQDKILNMILANFYTDDVMLINDRHIELIHDLIQSKKKNTYIYLPNNVKVMKEYDKLFLIREQNQVDNYEIELFDYAKLPNGKHIKMVSSCDTNGNDVCRLSSSEVKLPLYIRTRRHGEKMALKGTNGHKKIKDIFIDCKVAMKDRELWPVVVDSNNEVVWIPGLKKSKFNKQKNEKCDIIIKYY